jgi:hypothetical protein
MKKRLLIFSWEYNGYHSVQGTALSKRPRQVAESFNDNNWEVTVIHRDAIGESGTDAFKIQTESHGIKRIAVKSKDDTAIVTENPLLRKLETLYYLTFHGDRTYKWAKDVIDNYDKFGIDNKPDYILSFFTPRVPLFLGNYFSQKLGVPWLADLQDPIYEGVSKKSWSFCKRWMKAILSTAHAIAHISPEWAEIDAERLGLKVQTIRHAVPPPIAAPNDPGRERFLREYSGNFNVFYGGSISPDIQSLRLLKEVISHAGQLGIHVKVLLAGNNNAYMLFREELGMDVVKHLGWLSPADMNRYIFNCNCTLVVPWSKERIGIPSKFYELCSYPKPIWVIGYDLGAFKSLLAEWEHPPIEVGNLDFQEAALQAAIKNDFSQMFNLSNCSGKMLTTSGLYAEYSKLM